MHTHYQAGLRIAACGWLFFAGGAWADDTAASSSSMVPAVRTIPAEVPQVVVSELGRAIATDRLSGLRGGDGTQVDNLIDVDGSVDGNTARHITSGSNSIADGAFNQASGINTVIQNTGSNVLIQNAMIVTVDFAGGPQ